MLTFEAKRLTGRCANGAQRDSGTLYHAVESGKHEFFPAVCGAVGGKRSSGWADQNGKDITCKKCLVGLQAMAFG
jgi:hypothetical protein